MYSRCANLEEIFSGGEDRKEEKAFAEDSVYSFRNVFDLFCPTLKEHKATEISKLNSVKFVDEKISFFLLFSTVLLFCPLIYQLLFLLSFARIHKGTKINLSF